VTWTLADLQPAPIGQAMRTPAAHNLAADAEVRRLIRKGCKSGIAGRTARPKRPACPRRASIGSVTDGDTGSVCWSSWRNPAGTQQYFRQLWIANISNRLSCGLPHSQRSLSSQTPRNARSHRVGQPTRGSTRMDRKAALAQPTDAARKQPQCIAWGWPPCARAGQTLLRKPGFPNCARDISDRIRISRCTTDDIALKSPGADERVVHSKYTHSFETRKSGQQSQTLKLIIFPVCHALLQKPPLNSNAANA
jgi:hypothetical protein